MPPSSAKNALGGSSCSKKERPLTAYFAASPGPKKKKVDAAESYKPLALLVSPAKKKTTKTPLSPSLLTKDDATPSKTTSTTTKSKPPLSTAASANTAITAGAAASARTKKLSMKSTIAQMQEEATRRGIRMLEALPKAKADLLLLLEPDAKIPVLPKKHHPVTAAVANGTAMAACGGIVAAATDVPSTKRKEPALLFHTASAVVDSSKTKPRAFTEKPAFEKKKKKVGAVSSSPAAAASELSTAPSAPSLLSTTAATTSDFTQKPKALPKLTSEQAVSVVVVVADEVDVPDSVVAKQQQQQQKVGKKKLSMKMTLTELQQEATRRCGLDAEALPRKKADLLELLSPETSSSTDAKITKPKTIASADGIAKGTCVLPVVVVVAAPSKKPRGAVPADKKEAAVAPTTSAPTSLMNTKKKVPAKHAETRNSAVVAPFVPKSPPAAYREKMESVPTNAGPSIFSAAQTTSTPIFPSLKDEEPAFKKQKATNPDKVVASHTMKPVKQKKVGKKLSMRSTLADIQEEAIRRGMDVEAIPKQKADLLILLKPASLISTNEKAPEPTSLCGEDRLIGQVAFDSKPSNKAEKISIAKAGQDIGDIFSPTMASADGTKAVAPKKVEEREKKKPAVAPPSNVPLLDKGHHRTYQESQATNAYDMESKHPVVTAKVGKKLSMRSTLSELQEEAARRGWDVEALPNKKTDLLVFLNPEVAATSAKPSTIAAIAPDPTSGAKRSIVQADSAAKPSKKAKKDDVAMGETRFPAKPKQTAATITAISLQAPVKSAAAPTKMARKTGLIIGAAPDAPMAAAAPIAGALAASMLSVPVNGSHVSAPVPRISKKLSVEELQEEALCRGFSKYDIPNKKIQLLYFLVDGSIHLKETNAWKAVQVVKKEIEREKPRLLADQQAILVANERKQEAQRKAKLEKDAVERREREKVANAARLEKKAAEAAERKRELDSQRTLHDRPFPLVHPHDLARTRDLVLNGTRRTSTSVCNLCSRFWFTAGRPCVWTCEGCNFDICQKCFDQANVTMEEKERAADEVRRRDMEAQERHEKELREHKLQWNADEQFPMGIINPTSMNKKPGGSKMKGYTVWCSCGDRYFMPHDKEFDTTWKSIADANSRARYLFYWKNCYGIDAEDVECDEFQEGETLDGLKNYTVSPADSQIWSVGVVPDQAFRFLDNATSTRHIHDRSPSPLREDWKV